MLIDFENVENNDMIINTNVMHVFINGGLFCMESISADVCSRPLETGDIGRSGEYYETKLSEA